MRHNRLIGVIAAAAAAYIGYDIFIDMPRRHRLYDIELKSYHAAQKAPHPAQIDPIIDNGHPWDLERAVATTFLYTGGGDLFNIAPPRWDTHFFIFFDNNRYGLPDESVSSISQWLLSFNQITRDTSKPVTPDRPEHLYHLTPEGLARYINLRKDLARHSGADCLIPEQMATPLLTDYFVGKRILQDRRPVLEELFSRRA